MTDGTGTVQALRDRLTGLLADWGAELVTVLKELEEKRARVAELEGSAAGRNGEVETLRQRVDGQNTLIEALRGDAEEASKLRTEVRNRDLELERVNSELESKKELVRALRRDTDGTPLDEVHLDDDEDATPLPELRPDAAGVPLVVPEDALPADTLRPATGGNGNGAEDGTVREANAAASDAGRSGSAT